MATLSLCMIVKNEEDVIKRCLSCVKDIADEIIIVDTGSSDNTKTIASQFTDNIFDFPWCDDFSKARNYAFSKATMDYIMWLDADDIVTPEDQKLLLDLMRETPESTDMVMMKYHVGFDCQENPVFSYYRERIMKRSMNYVWVGKVHEAIVQKGHVIYSDIGIVHKKAKENQPERNLNIYRKMIADHHILDPREQYYYARELYYNHYYEEAIQQFKTFLQDENGWLENKIRACKDLAQCYYMLDNPQKALDSLLISLTYDQPRAEICCDIARHFFDRERYTVSVFWYHTAATCRPNPENGGFFEPDCYHYHPYIQLCVCYDRLGDLKKAMKYNELAGQIKPSDPSYLYNKEYFSSQSL